MLQFPNRMMNTSTTIDDRQTTSLSDFSSAASVDHVYTPKKSTQFLRTGEKSLSKDYSTDTFGDRYEDKINK